MVKEQVWVFSAKKMANISDLIIASVVVHIIFYIFFTGKAWSSSSLGADAWIAGEEQVDGRQTAVRRHRQPLPGRHGQCMSLYPVTSWAADSHADHLPRDT